MNEPLRKLLEKGFVSKPGRLLHVISPSMAIKLSAQSIRPDQSINITISDKELLTIPAYNSELELCKLLNNLFTAHSHPAITAALVHGSISVNEVVPYSDFDGILVINEYKLSNASAIESLCRLVRKSEKLIRQFDPLQHHGWSILFHSDLEEYNDASLPLLLLQKSKVIYPPHEVQFEFYCNYKKQNYKNHFRKLAHTISRKSTNNTSIKSFYAFKLFISEILLLPAVYIEAKSNKPVWKKESFDLARKDFTPDQFIVIDEVSHLRLNWKQDDVSLSKEIAAQRFGILAGIAESLATPLPSRYQNFITPPFMHALRELISAMQANLQLN